MFLYIKKRKIMLIISILVLIAGGVLLFNLNGNGKVETVVAQERDLVRRVNIAGKVVPEESADLGFEVSGTISSVNKSVGDMALKGTVLVSLDAEVLKADLADAESELASAQAELAKIEGFGTYETSVENAKRSLVQAMIDAYTAADDAIFNKADQFFTNPNSGNPQIFYNFKGYEQLRQSINDGRENLGYILDQWKEVVSALSTSSYTEEKLAYTKDNLNRVALFIFDVSRAVNLFQASESVTQTSIDKYKSDIATARDNLSAASQGLIAEEANLRDTFSNLPIQAAKVESAKARVTSSRAKLSRSTIVSPIDGIVSVQSGKIGQVVSPGTPIVSVISQEFILEAFVPEISIGGIQLGNKATITFDAFGNQRVFEGEVSHIDPAETIRDGVSTYRVELTFTDPEKLARSGMTANIEIEAFRKPLTTLIPERTVVREPDGTSYVYIYSGNGSREKRLVVLGEKDSQGNVEVLSGLSFEDKIILNP